MGKYNIPENVWSEAITLSMETFAGKNTKDGAQYTMTLAANEFCHNTLFSYLGGKSKVKDEIISFRQVDERADPNCNNWVWTMSLYMVMNDVD